MHFSKSYAVLLSSLPQVLQDNAVEYRQLKKLINNVAEELSSLGLTPEVLQALILPTHTHTDIGTEPHSSKINSPEIVYELGGDWKHIQPRLRLNALGEASQPLASIPEQTSLRFAVDCCDNGTTNSIIANSCVIIPLVSDTAFYHLLSAALQTVSTHLELIHTNFLASLQDLSKDILQSAKPSSAICSVQIHSQATSNPRNIQLHSQPLFPGVGRGKSDLYVWREIFQLYVDSEVFEDPREEYRGERPLPEAERRLRMFLEKCRDAGLQAKLKLKRSRVALKNFAEMNWLILDLKKFQFATMEATRKILKKHAKRTALPLPPIPSDPDQQLSPSLDFIFFPGRQIFNSLPRGLGQAIGKDLIPILPHVDDYSCIICLNIAYKPIRLSCRHLFCVRCLVKMQRMGKENCPICRAPSVCTANRTNVDWALINFMQDWFPIEARQKRIQNEKDAAREQLIALGIPPERNQCIVM